MIACGIVGWFMEDSSEVDAQSRRSVRAEDSKVLRSQSGLAESGCDLPGVSQDKDNNVRESI